jgi:hypothetical protein
MTIVIGTSVVVSGRQYQLDAKNTEKYGTFPIIDYLETDYLHHATEM